MLLQDAVANKILQAHDDEVFIMNMLNDEIDEQEKELLAEVKKSMNPLNFRGGMFSTFEPYKMKAAMFSAIPKLEWLKAEAIQLTSFDAAAHADKVIKYWCKRTGINIPATLLKRKSRTQEFEKWAGPIAQDLAKHVAGKTGSVDVHLLEKSGIARANTSPAGIGGGGKKKKRPRRKASVSGELSSGMKRKGKKKRKPSSSGAMFDALDGKGGGRKRRNTSTGLTDALEGKSKSKKKRRKRRASMAVSTAGALAEMQGAGRKRRGSKSKRRRSSGSKKKKKRRKKSSSSPGGGNEGKQPPPPPKKNASLI